LEQPLSPQPPGKVCGFAIFTAKRVIPEPPDSEKAGFARSGDSYGVFWSERYGAQCPVCGVFTKHSYCYGSWRDDMRTLYHRCPACDYRFKSIQEDPVKFDLPPEPEALLYLRNAK
jgi:hypothetical protein